MFDYEIAPPGSVGGEGEYEVGGDEYAVAGAADVLAEAMGMSSGEELLAVLGGALDDGGDGWAGASVEELLAAAAGASPRGRPAVRRAGAPVRRGGAPVQVTRPLVRRPVQGRPMLTRPQSTQPQPMQRAGGAVTRRPDPSKVRTYPPNFDSVTEVPAGAVIPVTQRPQVMFRPEMLIVPSNIGGDFLLMSLTVGKNPQAAAVSPGSCLVYSEMRGGGRIVCDTATMHDITLMVQNIGSAARRFLATIEGTAVE
ncbi:MAG: hypothetical protein SFX73_00785 [Kofleriaceae bacterium]|nr:hypothetical protein [Kofleriaceae bacterium]